MNPFFQWRTNTDTDTVFAVARPGIAGKTITTERMNPFPTGDRWPQLRAESE